jgi:PTH1 family peptidyl-tRNA hydrolase
MRLIVGLGNPGERYRRTRHNLGFMVLDSLAARAGARRGREESGALVSAGELGGESVLLIKPMSFMNRSGGPVLGLLRAYGSEPRDLVVVLDDVALPLGELRIRERGGHGGHNGLRSVIEVLGSEEFPRLRIGIRRDDAEDELADYVLSEFPKEDVLIVQEMVGYGADAVESIVREGVATAMNRFNGARKA